MLCSSCSQQVKPVVAVDIDGTLGDYHGHFINFAEHYLDCFGLTDEVSTYDGSKPFREWGCEAWGIDERTWTDIKLAYRQGAQKRSMPAYDGAAALCGAVVVAGGELWLTTTRPYLRLDNIDPDTRFWLQRENITGYSGLIYDEDKYLRLAEIVDPNRVVAVVDDLEEMVEQASRAFHWTVPMLRKTRFNRSVPGGWGDLGDVEDEIVKRIKEWKETHE